MGTDWNFYISLRERGERELCVREEKEGRPRNIKEGWRQKRDATNKKKSKKREKEHRIKPNKRKNDPKPQAEYTSNQYDSCIMPLVENSALTYIWSTQGRRQGFRHTCCSTYCVLHLWQASADLVKYSSLSLLQNEMIGALGLEGYTGPRTTWANEMSFVVKHAPGAGFIARPVDLQSSAQPLYHRCRLFATNSDIVIYCLLRCYSIYQSFIQQILL